MANGLVHEDSVNSPTDYNIIRKKTMREKI